MSFKGLRMLKIPKLPDFEKYWKSSKNIQRGDPWKIFFFSFLFNTLFYTRQSYKTIRMSFGGLRMLKSPKLTQCYSFASVKIVKASKSIEKIAFKAMSLCWITNTKMKHTLGRKLSLWPLNIYLNSFLGRYLLLLPHANSKKSFR